MNILKHIISTIVLIVLLSIVTYSQQYQPTNIAVTASGDQRETAITVDPNNSNHLMATWNDFNGSPYQPGYAFSTDGGNTWSTGLISVVGFDPSCAIDRVGREYYTYAVSSGPITMSYSTTDGPPWTTHQVSSSSIRQDKPYMAVDNTGGSNDGHIYVAWADFSSNDAIDFAYSPDQGTTWFRQTIQNLSSVTPNQAMYLKPFNADSLPLPRPPSSLLQCPVPSVGPDGTVYLVYLYLSNYITDGSSGTIQFAKSTNGGQSFSPPTAIANISGFWAPIYGNVGKIRASSYPTIAVDPTSGNIYVAYTQYDNGDYNIYYIRSTNSGSSWSSPAIATQSTSSLQFFPWLTVNSSGVVSLTYYQGNSNSVDVYVAESYNNGLSFSGADTKITSSSGNPGTGWTCDYMGATSTSNRNVFPFWTDFRSGTTANVYAALYNSSLRIAYDNKSFNQLATLNSSQRKLVQDGTSNYHQVFSSGGEIFYRKNVSGTWQNPIKISYFNSSNDYPCIALGSSNSIMIVWQRLIGTNTYEIYFSMSTDGGSTWSSANRYLLETSLSSSGPLPVITRNNNNARITVSYVSSSGLKAQTTTYSIPSSSNWTAQQITTSSEDTPSLSNCGTSSYNVIAYADADGQIHYRYQDSAGYWSTYNRLSTMIPGASINKSPTISGLSSDGSVHLAWVRYDNSTGYPQSPRIYYTNNSSANGSWPYQYWSILTEDEYSPSLAALASNKIDLLFTNGYNYLKYSRFNGSSWSSPVAKSTSAYSPSISSGSSTAKYVYTYGTLSPFTVTLSSETLSKANEVEGTYTRSIAILDSSGAYVELQLHNMYYKKNDGSLQKIDFLPVNLDTFNINTSNCWSLLASIKGNIIPSDANGLVFDYTINMQNADKIDDDKLGKVRLEVEVDDKNEVSLGKRNSADINVSSSKTSLKGEQIVSLSDFNFNKGTELVSFKLGLNGFLPKKGTFASLGNIFDFTSSSTLPKEQQTNSVVPTQYELQNYPNPFNPTTKISFSLPLKSQIKLKVFDVLGREIQILADGVYEAGKHEVEFNAINLPSGVYFYNLTTGSNSITKKMLLVK
ncbi:MAG: T9SS type A sorting domain-containing protein [Bacteroidota bacterium]